MVRSEPSTLPAIVAAVKPSAIVSGGILRPFPGRPCAARPAPARVDGMPRRAVALGALLVAVVAVARPSLAPDVARALQDAKYVYIQSERKGGELGKPAEIWFFVDGDTLYVGTRPQSWRVKRIKAGRTKARIAAGSPHGPAYDATGALVRDPTIEAKLLAAFAAKYPDAWPRYADGFRDGFRTGERVLVAYTPR
jgi:hypothetical protein